MTRLPFMTTVAVAALFAGAVWIPAGADPYRPGASGGKFEYGPYGAQNNPGSGSQAAPKDDNADGPPDDRDDGANAGQPPEDRNAGPPPREAAGPPPRDFDGGLPLVEVRASAPDASVPYEVREHDARQAAIEGWRSKVAARFGPEFSHWRTAAEKRVDCHPDRRDGLVCIASAQPVRGFDRYGQWHRDGRY